VPEGVAEILSCEGIGHGFTVSLAQLDTGNGDYGQNQINIAGPERSRKTFQQLIDDWHRLRTSSQNDDTNDEQFDGPERTTLSSLPALHFKLVRTDRYLGKIIIEQIMANNPHKDIVYSITLISQVEKYEGNRKLFKKLVDGFRYVPTAEAVSK